ncbi:cyclic AMP-responsive element-binding protein 1 isoform X5 [Zootermopsis nevadensis]|uniref:cyclic AMP-responsive element-binding protein 1 isoform X5 n=1 Tax=Zootermopsis nevadensis TaxID=136037 RepID=UPI000B8EDF29|nr:cyclic AMP-responsive element-binding protein 1 isoform X5 [Zootermopsis nevadensis]
MSVLKIYFNVILPSTLRSIQVFQVAFSYQFSFQVFQTKILYTFFTSMCASCPAHLIILNLVTLYLVKRSNYESLSYAVLPSLLLLSFSLGPHIHFSIFLKHLQSFLKMGEQVSHPYRTTVIPAGAIQIASQGETVQGLHTLTMTNATTAGGAIVQYAQGQDGQFFVPVVTQGGGIAGGPIIAEDQARKREMRLLKNREAARECRRKKKEYIKCLENRVAVLENQNKALIEELKSLKELYCQQKTD